jgi:RND family efflux transporter MFP subunit
VKKISLISIIIIFALIACDRQQTPQQTRGFRPDSRQETVIVEEIKLGTLNEYTRLTGVLEGKTDINFNSEISGRIVEVLKVLGDNVRKGEPIGRIDNRDIEIQVLQAEAAVLATEAALLSAETNYNANHELFQNKRLSEFEYHNSVSALKNAKAQLQNAKANLENRNRALQNSQFLAPVEGQIVDLPIRVGQTIAVGQKIAGIVDVRTLKIRTGVGENAIKSISRGQNVRVTQRNGNETIGRVSGIGLKPLANIATYPIEIEIPNRDMKFIPGMVVSCEILNQTHNNVVFILMSIVLKEYDDDFVFVVDANNIAHRRNVVLGRQISENVIVESGLAVGDRLVTEGFDRITDGARVIVREF